MKVKGILDTDFVNYKIPCMTIEMPICKGFKCDRECGKPVCQNSMLASAPTHDYSIESIIKLYPPSTFFLLIIPFNLISLITSLVFTNILL